MPAEAEPEVWTQLQRLATYSDAPPPAVTRVLFTPVDLAARRYLRQLIDGAGLTVREDAVGNLFARWEGTEPALAPVATGSHTDAVPNAGRFDGTVGVIGGLAAIRRLQRSGFRPRRAIELIVFTAEEPTRFGVGCLGSRALTGALAPDALRALRDRDGVDFETARQGAGYDGPLEEVPLAPGAYHAFVELHIEQGPELERLELPIGVVTHIAAPATLRVTLRGAGGHAGAVLMPRRRDALLAGAEVALAVEAGARGSASPDSVATTGVFDVFPGAVNSIPSRVTLLVDVRDVDGTVRDGVVGHIERAAAAIGQRRGVEVAVEVVNADAPATASAAIVETVEGAAAALGLASQRMVSRAYHDALLMPRLCPTGMIFVPCREGISHHPDEFASPEAIERGVDVLAGTLRRLAGDTP